MEADKAVGKTLESVSQSTGRAGRSGTGREDVGPWECGTVGTWEWERRGGLKAKPQSTAL